MQTDGLSLEQAPPLSIPVTYFLTAPLAIAGAGALLLQFGPIMLISGYLNPTLLLVHLGTLGFLAMIMFGAFYQMAPVVAVAPIPRIRLAHVVHLLLVVGLVGLFLSLGAYVKAGTVKSDYSFYCVGAAFLLFLAMVGPPMLRTETKNQTVTGMRLALLSLLLAGALGVSVAGVYGSAPLPGPRNLWMQVHLTVALLGWVGGLITAVSWQVVPMFYLSPNFSRRSMRVTLIGILAGITLPIAVLLVEKIGLFQSLSVSATRVAAICALPAVAVVWGQHPFLVFRGLGQRRRKRVDASIWFWRTACVLAPLVAIAAAATHLMNDDRAGILFGWLAIWGWAGMIVHGMLTRIVPFLVWFHRFSPLLGKVPVPSVKKILPERWTKVAFVIHLSSLIIGIAAIFLRTPWLARLTGALVAATAVMMALSMIRALSQRPDSSALETATGDINV